MKVRCGRCAAVYPLESTESGADTLIGVCPDCGHTNKYPNRRKAAASDPEPAPPPPAAASTPEPEATPAAPSESPVAETPTDYLLGPAKSPAVVAQIPEFAARARQKEGKPQPGGEDRRLQELLEKKQQLMAEVEAHEREIEAKYKKPVTVMFTDIKGSTAFFEEHGDLEGRLMVEQHNKLLFPIIKWFSGRVVKTAGDSIMAVFLNPERAVRAAAKMQRALEEYRKSSRAYPLNVRIGIHYGTGMVEENDVYGDVVNVASRLESAAEGGEILISGAVHSYVKGERDFRFVSRGETRLKGKSETVPMYEVRWRQAGGAAADASALSRAALGAGLGGGAGLAAGLLALVLGAAVSSVPATLWLFLPAACAALMASSGWLGVLGAERWDPLGSSTARRIAGAAFGLGIGLLLGTIGKVAGAFSTPVLLCFLIGMAAGGAGAVELTLLAERRGWTLPPALEVRLERSASPLLATWGWSALLAPGAVLGLLGVLAGDHDAASADPPRPLQSAAALPTPPVASPPPLPVASPQPPPSLAVAAPVSPPPGLVILSAEPAPESEKYPDDLTLIFYVHNPSDSPAPWKVRATLYDAEEHPIAEKLVVDGVEQLGDEELMLIAGREEVYELPESSPLVSGEKRRAWVTFFGLRGRYARYEVTPVVSP